MRRKNWRFVGAGGMLLVLACAFFLLMLGTASKSTDPVALMRIVGQTAGVAGGVGVFLIILGLLGKKFPDGSDQKP